ncbi:MAG: hypothetical protein GX780_08435, partial [Campylobacteraceae bacterium]|nr:hypothetical protein [Campylobacteraceae bacterium]
IMPNYLLEKIPLPSKQKSLYFKPNIANEAKIFTPSQINPKSEFLKQTIDQKLPLELRENFSKHKEDVAFAWISKLEAQAPSDAYKDLQTKLSEAIFKLKEVIKNQDSTALRLPAALKHIGDLGAQIKASLPQIDPKTNAIKDESLNDIKRALLSVEKVTKGAEGNIAKEVNAIASKALSQIDFHQLYSYVNQHSHAYLPYLWDGLQGGAIQFKKESEQIYCKIDLEFEKYKKVEILIALFNRHYISLTAGIEHPELFSRIKDNLKTLRELLSSVGLIPHTITLLPTLKDMSYESFSKEEIFGFDYKA